MYCFSGHLDAKVMTLFKFLLWLLKKANTTRCILIRFKTNPLRSLTLGVDTIQSEGFITLNRLIWPAYCTGIVTEKLRTCMLNHFYLTGTPMARITSKTSQYLLRYRAIFTSTCFIAAKSFRQNYYLNFDTYMCRRTQLLRHSVLWIGNFYQLSSLLGIPVFGYKNGEISSSFLQSLSACFPRW